MGIIDRYLERRGFVRAEPDYKSKAAGFMDLETSTYPDGRPDAEKIYDYPQFIQAYRSLPWLYAAATALAIACVKPELKVYREVKDKNGVHQEEVEGEDINRLIELPNAQTSYHELLQITVVNLWLMGNHYWNLVGTQEKAKITKANPPVEIWWVKPEQVFPKADRNGLIYGYEFQGASGQKRLLDPSEIVHFKKANPASYFLGMGVMEPLTNTAVLELNASTFMRRYMENDATPPYIFEHPGDPTQEQRKAFWTAWDERHKGPRRAGRAGMVWGGMKVTKIGETVKDAQYNELRKQNREEILAAMGVPPSVVGLLEYANYSNMEVQQKKFWEDAVMPCLSLIADKMTLRLAPLFDEQYWFEYDYSNIRALQEDEEHRARVADYLIGCGVKTPNQVRQEMFNEDPYPGGDQYFMKMTYTPIGVDPNGITEEVPAGAASAAAGKAVVAKDGEEAPKEGGSFWTQRERKEALWTNCEKRLSASTRAFQPKVEGYLRDQAKMVKERIASAKTPAHLRAADVFDVNAEVKRFKAFESFYKSVFERAGEAGYHATKGKLWIPPEERRIKDEDTFNPTAEHWAKLSAQIDKSARFFNESTWDVVKQGLETGLAENMTTEEIAQTIWQSLSDRAAWEARRIASTEMTRTEGWGQVEGYKQNDQIEMKGWLCSMLPTSRDDHIAADGEEVGLDEDFIVPPNGGYAMEYPGDERAPAEEVCNCRCSTYPVVGSL